MTLPWAPFPILTWKLSCGWCPYSQFSWWPMRDLGRWQGLSLQILWRHPGSHLEHPRGHLEGFWSSLPKDETICSVIKICDILQYFCASEVKKTMCPKPYLSRDSRVVSEEKGTSQILECSAHCNKALAWLQQCVDGWCSSCLCFALPVFGLQCGDGSCVF